MHCIIVDEIVRVNMHQRLDLQCGRGLDYHAKRKIDQIQRIMKIRVRQPSQDITQMSSAWFDDCIHF